MAYKLSSRYLTSNNTAARNDGRRTATQKAEDLTRHLESLKKIIEEENRPEFQAELDLYKIKRQWLAQIKHRAKAKKVSFDLTLDDLELPETCAILGIPLRFNLNGADDNSYSVDRIDNTKGYVKDNIQIISLKANLLKNKGTLEELIKIGQWANAQLTKNLNKA